MSKETKNHLLIAGTGRSGTSYLVRLLHECGLQTQLSTGFGEPQWHSTAAAGLENLPGGTGSEPYVVKSPWAYQFPKSIFSNKNITIDKVIIPVRNLKEAALSRVIIERQQIIRSGIDSNMDEDIEIDGGSVAGGAVFSLNPLDQARTLGLSLHLLIENLLDNDISFVFVKYPRFSVDSEYCYKFLKEVISSEITLEKFDIIHKNLSALGIARVENEQQEIVDLDITFPSSAEVALLAARREIRSIQKSFLENAEKLAAITKLNRDLNILNHNNYEENMEIKSVVNHFIQIFTKFNK